MLYPKKESHWLWIEKCYFSFLNLESGLQTPAGWKRRQFWCSLSASQPFLCVGYCAKVNLQEEKNHQNQKVKHRPASGATAHFIFNTLYTDTWVAVGKNKLGRTVAGSHFVLPRTWSDWLLNKTPSFLRFVSFITTQHALNHGIGLAFAGWNPELRHSFPIFFFYISYMCAFESLAVSEQLSHTFWTAGWPLSVSGYCKRGATKGRHWV